MSRFVILFFHLKNNKKVHPVAIYEKKVKQKKKTGFEERELARRSRRCPSVVVVVVVVVGLFACEVWPPKWMK